MGDAVNQNGSTPKDTPKEFLGMSDDDFLNLNSPDDAAESTNEDGTKQAEPDPAAAAEGGTPGASQAEEAGEEPAKDPDEAGDAAASSEPASSEQNPSSETTEDPEPGKEGDAKADAKADAEGDKKDADSKKEDKTESESEPKPVNYEEFYKQIMTPFKANGRMIELKSPDEAVRLMQMGAGYGRKIQDLQPHLKTLRMLEKNDLLDEGKLSFLIDINQKNPEAIKKLIKDAGIDPLDLNNEDNVGYKPTNHAVSDKEMAFQEALTDIQSHANGQETLRLINQTWDPDSKAALWDQPEIMRVIQSQRDNGIYDQIVTEMDRQKLLGTIPQSTPFLQAYKMAGDHLQANNGFRLPPGQEGQIQNQQTHPTEQSGAHAPQTQVIATRPAAPKAQVTNGEKAAAATPTKSSPSRGKAPLVNPLEMADDDFIKQFNGRL